MLLQISQWVYETKAFIICTQTRDRHVTQALFTKNWSSTFPYSYWTYATNPIFITMNYECFILFVTQQMEFLFRLNLRNTMKIIKIENILNFFFFNLRFFCNSWLWSMNVMKEAWIRFNWKILINKIILFSMELNYLHTCTYQSSRSTSQCIRRGTGRTLHLK
jgi:hypothetical protein